MNMVEVFDFSTGQYITVPYVPSPNDVDPTVELVPNKISPFQARAALMAVDLLSTAESAIQDAGPSAVIAWEYATEWRRDSPTIAAMASALGLSDEDVDNLFIQASKITA